MGNNPSTNNRPSHAASPSPSHDASRPSSTRRDPRSLIQAQRAPAEPSMAHARGTTATHRPRNSQSHSTTGHISHSSPIQSNNTPSPTSNPPLNSQALKEEPREEVRDQPSQPVNVPAPAVNAETASTRSYSQSIDLSGPSLSVQDMSYHLTRPPRLPLPIEEEVHTPGSPLNEPTDVDAPVPYVEQLDHEALPRRVSALSNTTIDEEDADELNVDKSGTTVPTTLEWRQGGEKVYVTGTIFQWNKKHRLHPVTDEPGLLRAVIHVRPGTHHIRFIVDGIMQCSQNLPTTVDFGNNLVNYIEVSADDLPREPEIAEDPIASSTEPEQEPAKRPEPEPSDTDESNVKAPRTRPAVPAGRFSSQIPQYLQDLDKPEDSAAYQYVATAIEKLPTPPSLPGFLGKPILNAATPMKDDNSVLTMPNHTVLNHLATSSIKNNVLAVSATTRYKKKYVTTIMYKPTGDD